MANKEMYLGSGPRDPKLKRSKYDWSFTNHMTAKYGLVYPCFLAECNEGDSLYIKPKAEFDFMPMVFPLQSKVTMHLSFFRCALRNLWKSYKDVVSRVGTHVFPYVSRNYNWHGTGSLADYMGIPSYSNEEALQWIDVRPFEVASDTSLNRFRRGTTIPNASAMSALPGIQNAEFQIGDSLNSIFTPLSMGTSALPSDSDATTFGYSYYLSDLVNLPIADNQPYLQLNVLTSTSTVVKLPDLRIGLLQYIKGAPGTVDQGRYAFYLGVKEYVISQSLTDMANIPMGTGAVVKSSPVRVNNTLPTSYMHTFCLHLSDDYVGVFNELMKDGTGLRIVVCWEQTSSNDSVMGQFYLSDAVRSDSLDITLTSPTAQVATYSNGHISLTSNTYQLAMAGLQNIVRLRVRNSLAKQKDESPFMIVSPATEPVLPLSVLPFRMYEFIHNLYFRNTQVDPFIKDGQPTYNQYLTNDGDGADSTTPLDFFHALYEYDFFTTAKFTPQAGNAPLVGISRAPGATDAVFHFVDENDVPYNLRVATTENGQITGISEYPANATESTVKTLNTLIDYGIDINVFRSVSAFVRYVERLQISNFDYKSVIKEFYGTNAPIGEEFPEYLGGMTLPVNIYKLENQTSSETIPLGTFAGTGRVGGTLDKHEIIKCFFDERSLVMGLVWFSVTPVYPQKLDKFWTKNNLLDFYNPQFATIGNQPIYNHEIAPLQAQSTEELMGVFGYQRPWYEYTMKMDEVHGQFRDTQHNYLIQREFATVPQLGKEFIEIENDDLTNTFAYTQGTDKIYGAIHFDVKYNSIVPKFISPRIVG